jgi:hypothetical protein
MADLIELPQWEPGIYQLETDDPVLGGEDGIDNLQAKQLANRTQYLKGQLELRLTQAQAEALIAQLVDSSPAALDTLNELAAALGDDPNFAATITNALALKAPLASPAFTDAPTAPTQAPGTNNTTLANTAFVQALFNTIPSLAGKQTCYIPAGAMKPRETNGAELITVQLGTNGTLVVGLAFDTATAEYAQFSIRMPKSWNEGTVTFTPVWTADSTSTNGVAWTMRAKAIGNDETIDAAWGSDVTVTDNNTSTAYQKHIAAESGNITVANAGELEWVVFEIYRNVSNGSDTLAVDAILTGVTLNYTTDAANDA